MKKLLVSLFSGIKRTFSVQQEIEVSPPADFSSTEWTLNLSDWAFNIRRDLDYTDIVIESSIYRFLENGIIVYCVERDEGGYLPIACYKASYLLHKKGGLSFWEGWHNAYFEFDDEDYDQFKRYEIQYENATFPPFLDTGHSSLGRAPEDTSSETQTA
jgi:hypothetical protein